MFSVKKGLLGVFLLAWSVAQAQVDIQTSIRDVVIGNSDERAGEITMVVAGDSFSTLVGQVPLYMRLRLDKGAVLSQTLVDSAAARNSDNGKSGNGPIRLAAKIDNPGTQARSAMDEDAVTIVRWRAGENQIWLQVNQSSSTWIDRNGTLGAPDNNDRVVFRFGNDATGTQAFIGSAFTNGLANLSANSRDDDVAADTLLGLDLRNTNLQPFPAPPTESLVSFDPIVFDASTQGVADAATTQDILLGRLVPVSFSGDLAIARGIAGSMPTVINRWLVHVPHTLRGFTSYIRALNPTPFGGLVTLRAFDSNDVEVGDVVLQLPGRYSLRLVSGDGVLL